MKKIGIIGYGGMAREIGCCLQKNTFDYFISSSLFHESSDHYKSHNVYPLDEFNINIYDALIAIGDPIIRKNILSELPEGTKFYTFIHPQAILLDRETIIIGEGSIICAGCVLTTNIILGKHSILNPNTTVGHDTKTKDRFTTFFGVNIAGNCHIGENVCFGSNSCVKEKINICDNVVIGMVAGVIKHIDIPGTYIGIPAKLIQ